MTTAASPATPLAMTFQIASSQAPAGPYVAVANPEVTLDGTTTPGAVVTLQRSTGSGQPTTVARTTANAEGVYHFKVHCAVGSTTLVARAVTASGASASADCEVTRANEAIVWNTIALQAVRTAHLQAPDAARAYAIVALAVYDAVDAIQPQDALYGIQRPTATQGASADAAAASAAHAALVGLFPAQRSMLDAELQATLGATPAGVARSRGVALGATVGAELVALRANDGSTTKVAYDPTPGPDVWTPTPPAYAPPVDPQWGSVTPFALEIGSQFQPPPPPAPTSAAFAADVAQVEAIGGATSTVRTADQTAIARFWSDLAGTFDPPGHWNQITDIAALAHHSDLAESSRTLALVDMALADAGIEAWSIKYQYRTARPVTVIQSGLDGINPLVTADPTWTPLWATPAFPSYVSGHSTFSASAAAVLDAVYGTSFAFTDPGDPSLNLAPRHFTSFDEAAQEAGISRIYGGIHYESDNLAGLAVGGQVGRYVVAHELLPRASTAAQP